VRKLQLVKTVKLVSDIELLKNNCQSTLSKRDMFAFRNAIQNTPLKSKSWV